MRAGSSSIDVDESTLIQGGWTPASLDTTWHIGNTRVLWRSSACSNTAGRSPPEDDPNNEGSGNLRVYGCQAGSSVVQLKVRNTGHVLGVVTITVNCVTNCGGDPPPGGGNPPPPQPTGWIEASPSKIVVGQTTTITAGWSNVDQDPSIVPSSTSLAPSCSGATGKSIVGPQQTQVMTGCSGATVAVTLRDSGTNKILASVTVKVYPKPLITSHSRIGYKYFKIGWLAKSDFTTFHVEWRHHGTTVPFVRLPGQASETSRARAEINAQSTGASIRALPYSSRDAEMQIVAVTTSGLEATSRPYRVPRGEQPHALGHLPDHRMNYSMSGLATSGDLLAGWIRAVAPSVARIWAAAVPGVEACQNDCPGDSGNKDGETVTLQIDGCRSVDRACYKGDTKKSVNWTIDGPGFMALNRQPRSPGLISIWTDVQAQDGEKVYPNGDPTVPDSLQHTYAWVKATVVHEFGHMFGLAHPRRPVDGILESWMATISWAKRPRLSGRTTSTPSGQSTRRTFGMMAGDMRMNMNGLWTVIVVLGALLVACVQEAPVAPAAASEPTPEQQEEQKADEGPIAATEAPSQETVSTPAPPGPPGHPKVHSVFPRVGRALYRRYRS